MIELATLISSSEPGNPARAAVIVSSPWEAGPLLSPRDSRSVWRAACHSSRACMFHEIRLHVNTTYRGSAFESPIDRTYELELAAYSQKKGLYLTGEWHRFDIATGMSVEHLCSFFRSLIYSFGDATNKGSRTRETLSVLLFFSGPNVDPPDWIYSRDFPTVNLMTDLIEFSVHEWQKSTRVTRIKLQRDFTRIRGYSLSK